jgi:crotonobetainyl-CoA:carnitine CoA-transferase CaiB-like acyl-CoA transferase
LADPLARAAGVFVDVPTEDGALKPLVASPADFGGTVINPGPAPQLGQHTEQVLLELGYQPSEILALRDEGAIL